jgi:hypothetical protein
MNEITNRSAIICGPYRYRLERALLPAGGQVAAVLMVNPSKADAEIDDQTIRKVCGFGLRLNFSKVIVGNEFAWRATDITELRAVTDPIGPDNDRHLEQIMRDADVHIVAWGALAKLPMTLRKRWIDVVRIADRVGCTLHCLGINDDGHPKHPQMTGYDVPLTAWRAPWFPNRQPARRSDEI